MVDDRVSRGIDAWCAYDHERALLPVDHAIIDSTPGPRALVLELAARGAHSERDLFSACAVLGRLIAERGGSPTLAAATMDGARRALGDVAGAADAADATWLVPAQAALFEGYASAQKDAARRDAAAGWEYPRCAVLLDPATLAVVAGYPEDDGEALAGWAGRVALAASLSGVRRAVIAEAGADRAVGRAALVEAMSLVGIEVLAALPARTSWLPWRRPSLIR